VAGRFKGRFGGRYSEERSMGCARRFRPTYAGGERGAPVDSLQRSQVKSCGIPHLAKNERDMGHPFICCGARRNGVLLRHLLLSGL
jgi:hypothetical protein